MAFVLNPFRSIPLDEALLELLIDEHLSATLPRLLRLWSYYRNALAEPDDRGGSRDAPAQMVGLPLRLVNQPDDRLPREIVIENDIAWRVHTLVDFMFPNDLKIVSRALTPEKRDEIEAILEAVITANGGVSMWQDAALLGSVYGHVDFMLNFEGLTTVPGRSGRRSGGLSGRPSGGPSGVGGPDSLGEAPSSPSVVDLAQRVGSSVLIETVEAPRAIPVLNRADYRKLDAYIIHYEQPTNEVDRGGLLNRLSRAITGRPLIGSRAMGDGGRRGSVTVTEIHTATHSQRYEDGQLVWETINRIGRLPIIHVQNLSLPFFYEGLSDVEPLVPLQDELNTRLSDRANRVTMQSFQMWLGKGIEGFIDRPIGPGQMWLTDNPDASIEAFGGDADSPSEKAHIEEIREALDKASGVTPAAAGHIKARVGNLTSENALRISLMGTIAKVNRKRVTYGAGIRAMCELILDGLDRLGMYATTPAERRVDIVWADALPIDGTRRVNDALLKAQLGVPEPVLRAELGYPDEEPTRTSAIQASHDT